MVGDTGAIAGRSGSRGHAGERLEVDLFHVPDGHLRVVGAEDDGVDPVAARDPDLGVALVTP